MTSCKDAAAKGLIDQDVELEINGEKKNSSLLERWLGNN